MTKQQDPRREQYEHARRAFEELAIEDRALFIVQETIGTVVRGIEEAGRALSRELDDLFREVEHEAEAAAEEAEAAAAPPPKTTARKTSTRKTAAKKTTTTKTPAKKTTAKKTTRKSTSKKPPGTTGDAS